MNRAFVKDPDDTGRPEVLPDRPQSPHTNYVTPRGLRQLQTQKDELVSRQARLVGEGKLTDPQELAVVQRDLRYVEERLGRAILVDPAGRPTDRVLFGATVEVCDPTGVVSAYTIVGEDEADPASGRISWISPLAEALLDAEVGDDVVWRRPAGTMRLEVLSIRQEGLG